MRKQETGLFLLKKPVAREVVGQALRDGSTGRVVYVAPERVRLERVWAVGEEPGLGMVAPTRDDEAVTDATPASRCGSPGTLDATPASKCGSPGTPDATPASRCGSPGTLDGAPGQSSVRGELAFYRKYTEALLRRYLRLSMQTGRVPSLMSRDVFRGNVSHYQVRGFEDVVIFCHDVEQRLAKLNTHERELIKRIALQRYTRGEAAGMLGISLNTCTLRYDQTVDRLTGLLLESGLLDLSRR